MLGWFTSCVEAFLKDTYGEEVWLLALTESGSEGSYPWAPLCPFSDNITLDLVGSAASVLGSTKEEVLEAFGVYFIEYTAEQGYDSLLQVLGADVVEFLENLDNMHLHLTQLFPEMKPPAFKCEKITPESVELHYYSQRPGLWPMVIGCIKALSELYLDGLQICIELLQSRDQGADHEVFLVKFPHQASVKQRLSSKNAIACDPFEPFEMTSSVFSELHPFHIVLDKRFMVLQCGEVLARLLPGLISGVHIDQYFKIRMPRIGFEWEAIKRESNGPVLIQSLATGLFLKGQWLFTGLPIPGCPVEQQVLVFMGSPRCENLDDLKAHSLFLSDIPIHDMSGDFVLLAEQRNTESDLKERFEALTIQLKDEKACTDALVQRMSGLVACFPFKATKEGASFSSRKPSFTGSPMSGSFTNGGQDRVDVVEAVRMALGPITSSMREEDDVKIELVEAIGEGTYGKVYRGLWQGTEVAVKTMILPASMSGSAKREKMAIMETAISSTLSHPNVVQTYTYSIKPMRDSAAAAVVGAAVNSSMAHNHEPARPGLNKAKEVASAEAYGVLVGGGTDMVTIDPVNALDPSGQLPKMPCHQKSDSSFDLGLAGVVLGGATDMVTMDVSVAQRHAMDAGGCMRQMPAQQKPDSSFDVGLAGVILGKGTGTIDHTTQAHATPSSSTAQQADKVANGDHKKDASTGNSGGGGAIHSYEISLVLEFCDLGSLRNMMDEECFILPDESLNYQAILDTALDIAKAMLHLHRNNVLHADLKSLNILLRSAGDSGKGFIAKVADFGLSVKIDKDESHMSNMCQGTLTHMSPELMMDGHMSKAADVYAFGILLWELYTGGAPYKGTPKALLGHQVATQDKRPKFESDTPPEYKQLAQWCWAKEKLDRPTFEDVLHTLIGMRTAVPGPTRSALPTEVTGSVDKIEPTHRVSLKAPSVPINKMPVALKDEGSGQSYTPEPDTQEAIEGYNFGSALHIIGGHMATDY